MDKDGQFYFHNVLISKDDRFYYEDGQKFVRVTEVLSCLNRPGLNKWQANLGTELAEEYSSQMRDIGSEVHGFIAQIIKGYSFRQSPEDGLKYAQLDKTIRNGLKAWNQAMLSIPFKPVQSEIFLISKKYGYAGTTDCLARIGHKKWLLDWKTGTIFDPRTGEIYPEIPLQLAAYYHAYKETYPSHKLTGCAAVHLSRDTGLWTPKDIYKMDEGQLEKTFDAFAHLIEVWKYLTEGFKCHK